MKKELIKALGGITQEDIIRLLKKNDINRTELRFSMIEGEIIEEILKLSRKETFIKYISQYIPHGFFRKAKKKVKANKKGRG